MSSRGKLAIIGDPHLAIPLHAGDERLKLDAGRKLHEQSAELLAGTISQINAEPGVEAVLVLGDLTRDSEEFNHEEAAQLLGVLDAPHYLLAGNHDMAHVRADGVTYPDVRRFDRAEFAAFYAGRGLPGGSTDYVVRLPADVDLIVLDSAISALDMERNPLPDPDAGLLTDAQFAWAEEQLLDCRQRGHEPLVALHHTLMAQSPAEHPGHPLESTFRFWQVGQARTVLDLLMKYEVRLALSGHLHLQSVNAESSLTNLVTSACVSYPHAWRLLHLSDDSFYAESRRLEEIPSMPGLQEQSASGMGEGMARIIRAKLAAFPQLTQVADELSDMVRGSGWWERLCDGTQAGFAVAPELIPLAGSAADPLIMQIVGLLNEYGSWKAARPNPNELEIGFSR